MLYSSMWLHVEVFDYLHSNHVVAKEGESSYLVGQSSQDAHMMDSDDESRPKQSKAATCKLSRFLLALQWLFVLLPTECCTNDPFESGLIRPDITWFIYHFCVDVECCNNFSRAVSVSKVSEAIVACLFRFIPCIPIMGKWLKCGKCLDAILPMLWFHNLLQSMVALAFSSAEYAKAYSGLVVNSDADHSWVEEVAWHAVAGKRHGTTSKYLSDVTTVPLLTILAILKEASRFLTTAYLRCASSVQDPSALPRLFDFCTAEYSPVTIVQQYCSMLLRGLGRRLRLLWGRGYRSNTLHSTFAIRQYTIHYILHT
jgi:hypothetical protein